jgi:hypothetical protein
MTTTPIYEPIAHISDDYFRWPNAGGFSSNRDDTYGRGAIQTRGLAQNAIDNNAIRPDSNLREANGSTRSEASA